MAVDITAVVDIAAAVHITEVDIAAVVDNTAMAAEDTPLVVTVAIGDGGGFESAPTVIHCMLTAPGSGHRSAVGLVINVKTAKALRLNYPFGITAAVQVAPKR